MSAPSLTPLTQPGALHEPDFGALWHSRDTTHFHRVHGKTGLAALVSATTGGAILTVTTRPGSDRVVQLSQFFAGCNWAIEVCGGGYVSQVCTSESPTPHTLLQMETSPAPAYRVNGCQAMVYDEPVFHLTMHDVIAVIGSWLFEGDLDSKYDWVPFAHGGMHTDGISEDAVW